MGLVANDGGVVVADHGQEAVGVEDGDGEAAGVDFELFVAGLVLGAGFAHAAEDGDGCWGGSGGIGGRGGVSGAVAGSESSCRTKGDLGLAPRTR